MFALALGGFNLASSALPRHGAAFNPKGSPEQHNKRHELIHRLAIGSLSCPCRTRKVTLLKVESLAEDLEIRLMVKKIAPRLSPGDGKDELFERSRTTFMRLSRQPADSCWRRESRWSAEP